MHGSVHCTVLTKVCDGDDSVASVLASGPLGRLQTKCDQMFVT